MCIFKKIIFCIHTHINKYAKININIFTYIPPVCLCVIKLPVHKWNWTELMPMTHVQPVDASGPCIIPCNFCREMGSHDGRPSTNAQRCGNLGAFDKKATLIPWFCAENVKSTMLKKIKLTCVYVGFVLNYFFSKRPCLIMLSQTKKLL